MLIKKIHYYFCSVNRITVSSLSVFFLLSSFLFPFGEVNAIRLVKTGIPTNFYADTVSNAEYEWTFPDGSTKTGKVVSYTFEKSGETSVTLKITKNNKSNQITKNVFVQNNNKPTAIPDVSVDGEHFYGGHIKIKRDQDVSFTSQSVDSNGNKEDLTETWWVKGRVYKSETLPHIFSSPGIYPIKLVVARKNNTNLKDSSFFNVEVLNSAPVIKNISFTKDKKLGAQLVTVSTEAFDEDGEILRYRFEVLEYNQTKFAQVTQTNSASFNLTQFPGDHKYSFRVIVTDSDHKSSQKTSETFLEVSSTVKNNAPDVKMMLSPGNSGTTDTTFYFSVKAEDKDNDALRYEWTLSNGQRFFEKSFSHQFKTAGIKQATLRVSDGIETVKASVEIVVAESEVMKNQPPTVNIKGVLPSTAGDTNTIFSFFSEINDPDNDEISVHWEMGDGKIIKLENAGYKFSKPGKYKVKLIGSDGKLERSDEIVIEVVNAGSPIPENKSFNDVSKITPPISQNIPLAVKIDSPANITRNYSPFNPTLKKILISEKKWRTNALGDSSEDVRKTLTEEIDIITKKINQLENSPFFLRGEFKKGRITQLTDERDILVQKYKEETRSADKRKEIQEKILELSKAIRRRELGLSKELLVEDILIKARDKRTEKLKGDLGKKEKNNTKKEIAIINTELKKLRNNPFLARTQEVKELLLLLKSEREKSLLSASSETKTKLLKQQIQQINDQIALIDQKPDKGISPFIFANLTGTPNTKFFFYGQAPKELKQALFFEWELGKNIHIPGQNISLRYKKPGLYRIKLTVSDGTNQATDTITIKIVENQKKD